MTHAPILTAALRRSSRGGMVVASRAVADTSSPCGGFLASTDMTAFGGLSFICWVHTASMRSASLASSSVGVSVVQADIRTAIEDAERRCFEGGRFSWGYGNIQGGLSGPAIKPIALLKVKQVYEVAAPHKVPIIGQGGICSAEDALEFIIAGAATVGVGTALFYDPLLCRKINAGIAAYLEEHGFGSIAALTGTLQA